MDSLNPKQTEKNSATQSEFFAASNSENDNTSLLIKEIEDGETSVGRYKIALWVFLILELALTPVFMTLFFLGFRQGDSWLQKAAHILVSSVELLAFFICEFFGIHSMHLMNGERLKVTQALYSFPFVSYH
jgi:hypothetical protein